MKGSKISDSRDIVEEQMGRRRNESGCHLMSKHVVLTLSSSTLDRWVHTSTWRPFKPRSSRICYDSCSEFDAGNTDN